MSFFNKKDKQQKKREDRRKPDFTARLTENIGAAVWYDKDGNHEVKLGQYVSYKGKDGDEKIWVRMVVPLSSYGELVQAMETVTKTFGHKNDDVYVPAELRESLTDLANRLEVALVPLTETEAEINGAAAANPFGAAA